MREHFDSDAHEYLLNQMDAGRRRAFELELERDPAARAAFKAQADAFAGFAREVATPEALSPADQRAALDAILHAVQPAAAPPANSRGPWRRWLWPAAAALFLALNLLDFNRPLHPGRWRDGTAPSGLDAESIARGDPRGGGPEANALPGTKSGEPPGAGASVAERRRAEEAVREIDRLRENLARLRQEQDRMRLEYDLLARRVADQAVAERDLNRLSTMELVDAASYGRGERKGLVNVGRSILTEPGVVIVPDPNTPPPSGTAATVPKQPYAWSVYDEKEHRGYLNLYQLPTLPEDQAMQVWVRTGDAMEFQRAAEVPPQLQGGNGSVQYVLPATSVAPAEILVTIEPRGIAPTVPRGPTVLRGP